MQASVHQHQVVPFPDERAHAEPPQQRVAIGRLQNVLQGVSGGEAALPVRGEEQMQIVVSEHTVGAEFDQPAKHARRRGAAIHQITDEPELVTPGLFIEHAEQVFELGGATLHVTHEDA
jgi:hypothetical protein